MTSISSDTIDRAADCIRGGGLVVFPTRCLYGIAVDAFNPDAVGRVYRLKERRPDKPLPLIIHDPRQLDQLVPEIPPKAELLIRRFWPGRLTLVFSALSSVPDILCAATGKVGVRLAAHPAAVALAGAVGGPITATSANLSGLPGCRRILELHPAIADGADMIIDAGELPEGAGSTVVDVTVDPPVVLREGVIAALDVFNGLAGDH